MSVLPRIRPTPSGFVVPCLPTAARIPPPGRGWLHEIKHDGYRLMARLECRWTRLFSRRGHDRAVSAHPSGARSAAREISESGARAHA
jgi:ATP-dependent DNA ligase